MKVNSFLLLICSISVLCYDRGAVVKYASSYWNYPNHKCGDYMTCSPYSYQGNEACGYKGSEGDSANYVSQCLLAGGHPPLKEGKCRGYPCFKEEVGVQNLAHCLENNFDWTSSCGVMMPPPANVRPGDVIIYHEISCWNFKAHAAVVVSNKDGQVKVASHSTNQYGVAYNYMGNSMPYYQWLRNPN